MAQLFKILSLDGGGIRGLIPAMMLAEIERRTGKPIYQLYDLIAGTSTGGIISLGLTRPDADGNPTFSAEAMIDLYESKGSEIFSSSFVGNVASLWGILNQKYDSDGIEQLLIEYFGDSRLSDSLTDVLITAYDIRTHRPFFFKSRRARKDAAQNFLMREVARSTSAAPTFFEPKQIIRTVQDQQRSAALIDGGVMANNPSMCAFAEAKVMISERDLADQNLRKSTSSTRGLAPLLEEEEIQARSGDNDKILVTSIGTGEYNQEIAYQKAKSWGMIGWVQPLIDIMFVGASYSIDFQLKQLLPKTLKDEQRYFRFQGMIEEISVEMDNIGAENIVALKRTGAKMVKDNSKALDDLCKQLT